MGEESRRKRRWDQPDKSFILPNISLPEIFPVANVGFLPFNQLNANATQAPILLQQAVALKPQDELLIAREIVINDAEASVRYKLTRRQTQEEIQKCTGAVVITRGKYRPPNAMPDGEKPLYLHVSAGAHLKETAEKIIAVDRAAALVEDMMRPTMKAFNTSVYLGFDADPSLNIPTRIRGPNDQYINHIMNETGVTVMLRGHGSGYGGGANLEGEGEQPLHLLLSSCNPKSLEDARLLVENLLDTISRECGMARIAPVKVYAAVPPPQNLLTGVQYSGVEGNSCLTSTPLAPVVANCSAATAISPAASLGFSPACTYGLAAQAVQSNGVCYTHPSLGMGTCYRGYGGLYPQPSPFQQVSLAPRQTCGVSSATPHANTATSTSENTLSLNDKRPPQKRKFKELPAASKGTAVAHQVSGDPIKALFGEPGNVTVTPPPKKLAKEIPPLPPVPKFSSAPTKSMLPPPPPKFNSPVSSSTASVHRGVSITDVNPRKSMPEDVPDTLVRLMQYGEDDDDDPD